MSDKVIKKYLDHYAEKEALELTVQRKYDHSLVIPANREILSSLKAVWRHITEKTSILVIVVINSNNADEKKDKRLFDELMKEGPKTELKKGIYHVTKSSGPDLLIIDRFSKNMTIKKRQGVGLARKIGSDVALQLYHSGCINSHWLRNTDADAVLPADYFDFEVSGAAGFLYPFVHLQTNTESTRPAEGGFQDELATSLYDLSLLYYPAGLLWAGSPYGFPTIGSTLCCAAEAYAHVRGFPKRSYGEDFYLLNKLCKVGPIRSIHCSPIELSPRHSNRVPIGTGQAIAKISSLDNPIEEFQFDHPLCFIKLRELLQILHEIAYSSTNDLLHKDQTIKLYAETSGLENLLGKLKNQLQPKTRLKFMMDWFDALRTRQFIHYVRDRQCGSLNILELTQYLSIKDSTPFLTEALRYHLANQIYR